MSNFLITYNSKLHVPLYFSPVWNMFFFNTSIKYYLLCYLLLTQNCLTIRAIKVLSNCKSHLPKHFSFHKRTEVKLGFSILAKHTLTCRPEKPGIKLPTLWLAENLPYQVSHIRASFPTFIYFLYASLLLWRLKKAGGGKNRCWSQMAFLHITKIMKHTRGHAWLCKSDYQCSNRSWYDKATHAPRRKMN